MMCSKAYLVVDLGGTNVRVAALNSEGRILHKTKESIDSKAETSKVLRKVADLLHAVAESTERDGARVHGVSLGFPGIVDPTKGIVYQSPHFPDWKDLNLREYFELPWPLVVDNDAKLATLGEGWKGAGAHLENFILLTLGTGVGGGISVGKKIFRGDRGFAGELGHFCIECEGPSCACGSRGCWEMYVSTQGLLRSLEHTDDVEGRRQLLEKLQLNSIGRVTVKHLHEAALDGDLFAGALFRRMGHYLGIGIASLANAFGIENFIIGGGISDAWNFFADVARREIHNRIYPEVAQKIILHKCLLGDDAALVGGVAAQIF